MAPLLPSASANRSEIIASEVAKAQARFRLQLSRPRDPLTRLLDDPDFDFSGGHRPPTCHRVLFMGPPTYSENVWDTRAKYILPDLFASIAADSEIGMLLPDPPDFAAPLLRELAEQFRMKTYFTGQKQKGQGGLEYWMDQLYQACEMFRPTVVTNLFGAMLLGSAAGLVRSRFGYRSVVRFAGDEIAARVAMRKYAPGDPNHAGDVRNELLATNLADAVIAMSPWEQSRLQQCVDHPSKVHVCIRGVDLTKFLPPSAPRSWPAKHVLFVGRKSEEKGCDIVEKAADLLADNSDIQFWFAGPFERSTSGNRHYLGFVQPEDLPALYQRMDALVLTSRTEGFPQVVVEAMATGLPTILSRHLFENMFRHRRDAMLTELRPGDLVSALGELFADRALYDRLSTGGREFARKHFDHDAWKKSYRSVLLGEQIDGSGPALPSTII